VQNITLSRNNQKDRVLTLRKQDDTAFGSVDKPDLLFGKPVCNPRQSNWILAYRSGQIKVPFHYEVQNAETLLFPCALILSISLWQD